MPRTFHLEIYTPERPFYQGNISSLILPALDGFQGVMAGHAPMVTAIEPGVLRYRTEDGRWHLAAVSKGFAEITSNRAVLLVSTAERPSEIDEQRAQEAMERAAKRLHRLPTDQEEYRFSLNALARARARLEAKRQREKME